MAFRYSVELRNAGLDARIDAVGPAPVLKIYASAQAMGRAPSGELVSIQLPRKWMSKAEDGVASSLGEWVGKAVGEGKAKSFGIYSGDTCHIDGAIPEDLKLDTEVENPMISPGLTVTVSAFTIKSGNG